MKVWLLALVMVVPAHAFTYEVETLPIMPFELHADFRTVFVDFETAYFLYRTPTPGETVVWKVNMTSGEEELVATLTDPAQNPIIVYSILEVNDRIIVYEYSILETYDTQPAGPCFQETLLGDCHRFTDISGPEPVTHFYWFERLQYFTNPNDQCGPSCVRVMEHQADHGYEDVYELLSPLQPTQLHRGYTNFNFETGERQHYAGMDYNNSNLCINCPNNTVRGQFLEFSGPALINHTFGPNASIILYDYETSTHEFINDIGPRHCNGLMFRVESSVMMTCGKDGVDPFGSNTFFEWDRRPYGFVERVEPKIPFNVTNIRGWYEDDQMVAWYFWENGVSSRVLIDKSNGVPTIDSFAAPSRLTTGSPIVLQASGHDVDGRVGDQVAYKWTVDGVLFEGPRVDMTAGAPGQMDVQLEVADSEGATALRTHTIEVIPRANPPSPPPNPPAGPPPGPTPVQNLPPQLSIACTTNRLEATCTGIVQDEGPVQVSWSADGQSATGLNAAFTLEEGPHTISATATDAEGLSAIADTTVVIGPFAPPTVSIKGPATAEEGAIRFTLELTDGDSPPLSIAWRLNGELVATGKVAHLDLAAGQHQVSVKVTDDLGKTASDSHSIVVSKIEVAEKEPEIEQEESPAPFVLMLLALAVFLRKR